MYVRLWLIILSDLNMFMKFNQKMTTVDDSGVDVVLSRQEYLHREKQPNQYLIQSEQYTAQLHYALEMSDVEMNILKQFANSPDREVWAE